MTFVPCLENVKSCLSREKLQYKKDAAPCKDNTKMRATTGAVEKRREMTERKDTDNNSAATSENLTR